MDTHSQLVAKSFDSHLESSFNLLQDIKTLSLLPNCELFTADATSACANIDAESAITATHACISDNQEKFPHSRVVPLTDALRLLVHHNVFHFGDACWRHLAGAAMGAPPAPAHADPSFAAHEYDFVPKHNSNLAHCERQH